MSDKQIKNWTKMRKFGFLGFYLFWLIGLMVEMVNIIFIFDISLISGFYIGSITAGTVVIIVIWRINESKYKNNVRE
jgi:hypothetical protein